MSLDRSFSVNLSYVLLEKPASVYFDEVHHSVSIVAELVSKYGIHSAAASGFSKLQSEQFCHSYEWPWLVSTHVLMTVSEKRLLFRCFRHCRSCYLARSPRRVIRYPQCHPFLDPFFRYQQDPGSPRRR